MGKLIEVLHRADVPRREPLAKPTRPSSGRRLPHLLPAPTSPATIPAAGSSAIAIAGLRERFVARRQQASELLELDEAGFARYVELMRCIEPELPSSGPRSVLLTSVRAGEGKTEVATNLAFAATQSGSRRVAVLDLRPGSRGLADRLELPAVPGLSEVLSQEIALSDAVRWVSSAGYAALVAGRDIPDSTTILKSRRMSGLFEQLAQSYDLIIAEAPHTANRGVAAALAGCCGALFLVVEMHRTRRQEVDRAIRLIQEAGGSPRGCILAQPAC